jgi:hypothetical protein
MAFKLGRLHPDYSKPRLWAEDYIDTSVLPPQKPNVDYCTAVTTWPMYLNDQLGDCTCAGMGHCVGAWSQYESGTEAVFSDSAIESLYSAVSGYVPGEPDTDNGALLQTVLQYMQQTGVTDEAGKLHKVQAYAQLKEMSFKDLNQALQVFGTVYLGVNLPQSAEDQFSQGLWTYVKGSPIIGGHCIVLQQIANRPVGDYTIISWGATVNATKEWMSTYLEEAWVPLSPDWLNAQGDTITGLDVEQLTADMHALA